MAWQWLGAWHLQSSTGSTHFGSSEELRPSVSVRLLGRWESPEIHMDTKIDGLVWSSPVYGLLVDLVEVAKLKFGACNSSLWANMMAMISWISGPEDRLLWVEPLWIGPPLCNLVIKCNQGYSLSNTHNIWRLLTRRVPLYCEHNLETQISYIYIMMRVNFQGACVLNCMQISNTRVISMASVVLPSPSPPVRLKEANQTYIIYLLWFPSPNPLLTSPKPS